MLAGLSIVINLWIFAQILNEKQAGVAMPTVLPGLDGSTPVQLTIEPNGMVHINASTMHDAFYAQGAVRPRALVQSETNAFRLLFTPKQYIIYIYSGVRILY